jgi:hypothetical protein
MPKPVEPERLIATPDRRRPGRFTARLESTGEEIVSSSRQPLVDGARQLLARGFDPAAPLTMRVEGKTYDSFNPLPIGEWAKWTYVEEYDRGLRRRRWMPPAVGVEAKKPGVEAPAGTEGNPETKPLTEGGHPQPAPLGQAA